MTLKELDETVTWAHETYNDTNVDTYAAEKVWHCVGCEFMAMGKAATVRAAKSKHKKSCLYYRENTCVTPYEHLSSRCFCCIWDQKQKKKINGWKVIFTFRISTVQTTKHLNTLTEKSSKK